MPESPEVKTITDQLHHELSGKPLSDLEIIGGRFLKSPPENLDKFDYHRDASTVIESVRCKGKFIYFTFSNDSYLFNTLGMTGNWSRARDKHSALRMNVEGDVFFTDPRRFGTLKFVFGQKTLQEKLDSLGYDLLQDNPDKQVALAIMKKVPAHKAVCQVLMDQSIWAGVGNYIKSEALYRVKMSPWRVMGNVSQEELENLYDALQDIMRTSYAMGGASIATYKSFQGKIGGYSKHFQVYKKAQDLEGREVTGDDETPDKRTSWWVKGYQK